MTICGAFRLARMPLSGHPLVDEEPVRFEAMRISQRSAEALSISVAEVDRALLSLNAALAGDSRDRLTDDVGLTALYSLESLYKSGFLFWLFRPWASEFILAPTGRDASLVQLLLTPPLPYLSGATNELAIRRSETVIEARSPFWNHAFYCRASEVTAIVSGSLFSEDVIREVGFQYGELAGQVLQNLYAQCGVVGLQSSRKHLRHLSFVDAAEHISSRVGYQRGVIGRRSESGLPSVSIPPPSDRSASVSRSRLKRSEHAKVLTQIIEARTSSRNFGPSELSGEDLSRILDVPFKFQNQRDASTRPSRRACLPTGGNVDTFQVVAWLEHVEEFERGLYKYDRSSGTLSMIVPADAISGSLKDALSLDARFEWNYSAVVFFLGSPAGKEAHYSRVGYALLLKEIGVIMAYVYLMATALDIGCCALGSADSVLIDGWVRDEFPDHIVLGEVVVGTKRESSSVPGVSA